MTAETIIAEIKTLPPPERAKVLEFCGTLGENDDSWIPDSFKRGMADVADGRVADMDLVLSGTPPPVRRT